MLPGGRGYRVRFLPPWQHWPSDDAVADAIALNRWIEDEVRRNAGAVPVGAQALQDPAGRRAEFVLRDNARLMKLRFTKMHGAGNDFVVLDATLHPVELSAEQARRLADRRFGVGADQILVVEPAAKRGRRLRLPHLQRERRRGRAVRQRRALLRPLRARQAAVRQAHDQGADDEQAARADAGRRRPRHRRHGSAGLRSAARAVRRRRARRAAGQRFRALADRCRWFAGRGGGAVDGQPACGAARDSTSTRRRSRARPGDRIASSLPAQGQRGVHAGGVAASDPAARLRARRRRDAGLRHRRLRRGRGRHPPRLARLASSTCTRTAAYCVSSGRAARGACRRTCR